MLRKCSYRKTYTEKDCESEGRREREEMGREEEKESGKGGRERGMKVRKRERGWRERERESFILKQNITQKTSEGKEYKNKTDQSREI